MLIQLAEPQHTELLHSYSAAIKHKIEPTEVTISLQGFYFHEIGGFHKLV